MPTSESIKREMKDLVEKQEDLVKLASDKKDIVAFGTAYQKWYARAYKLVESLGPERLEEFVSYYLINPNREIIEITNYVIQDYIQQIGPIGIRGREVARLFRTGCDLSISGSPRWLCRRRAWRWLVAIGLIGRLPAK